MKKLYVAIPAMVFGILAGSANCQESKIPVLEAFRTCNTALISPISAPLNVSRGLLITRIVKEKENGTTRIKLIFNKAADPNKENQAGMIKRMTGYDFTDLDRYEIDEASGGPWIACSSKK